MMEWVRVSPEGKVHRPNCYMIRAHMTGTADGRYAAADKLSPQDLVRWRVRLSPVTDPDPSEICLHCVDREREKL